jgi:hypothetical protein
MAVYVSSLPSPPTGCNVAHWVDIVFHDIGILRNIDKELAKQP